MIPAILITAYAVGWLLAGRVVYRGFAAPDDDALVLIGTGYIAVFWPLWMPLWLLGCLAHRVWRT